MREKQGLIVAAITHLTNAALSATNVEGTVVAIIFLHLNRIVATIVASRGLEIIVLGCAVIASRSGAKAN